MLDHVYMFITHIIRVIHKSLIWNIFGEQIAKNIKHNSDSFMFP